MTVDEEKEQVRALRDTGLTLQQIATKVGRSIGWVYSRLNEDYAPQRKRATTRDTLEELQTTVNDPELLKDLVTVRRLRDSGMTYRQIATELDRSIYWVHSRLSSEYQPRDIRIERLFQEQAVVPWLVAAGHTIISQCQRIKYGAFVIEADIVSEVTGRTCITEVKAGANGHEMHTAIGQLTLQRCLAPQGGDLLLQVAFPEAVRSTRMDDNLISAISLGSQIVIVFIPWGEIQRETDGTNQAQ